VLDSTETQKFPLNEDLKGEEVKVEIEEDQPLISHLKYNEKIEFKGDIELLTGRGYFDPKKLETDKNIEEETNKPGEKISKPEYYFSPGTQLTEEIICVVTWDGTLRIE